MQVKLLLNAVDYDLNARDHDGNTALFYAANSGHRKNTERVTKALQKFKLPVDIQNKSGFTPLLQACRKGNVGCAKVIVEIGGGDESLRDSKYQRNANDWMQIALDEIQISKEMEENRQRRRKMRFDDPEFLRPKTASARFAGGESSLSFASSRPQSAISKGASSRSIPSTTLSEQSLATSRPDSSKLSFESV